MKQVKMKSDSTEQSAQELLMALFQAAVEAAQPKHCLPAYLPPYPEQGKLIVIGAGKASAAMAVAVEDYYNRPLEGLIITRYGYAVPTTYLEVVEAAHPVPDQAGCDATQRILDLVSDRQPEDLILVLISGGGSALLTGPTPPLTLIEKQKINAELLKSGAPIGDMNIVRKQFSRIKGGGLGQ